MTNLHVITMKRKIYPRFTPVAELGSSTVTNRIWCRHLITDGGTKVWVTCTDVMDNAVNFKVVDGGEAI